MARPRAQSGSTSSGSSGAPRLDHAPHLAGPAAGRRERRSAAPKATAPTASSNSRATAASITAGVHGAVDLAQPGAAGAVHQPARLHRQQQRLAPLRLHVLHHRAAAAGGRLPRDAAKLVAGDVRSQALELAPPIAGPGDRAGRPRGARREQALVAQLQHVGPGDAGPGRLREAALAERKPRGPSTRTRPPRTVSAPAGAAPATPSSASSPCGQARSAVLSGVERGGREWARRPARWSPRAAGCGSHHQRDGVDPADRERPRLGPLDLERRGPGLPPVERRAASSTARLRDHEHHARQAQRHGQRRRRWPRRPGGRRPRRVRASAVLIAEPSPRRARRRSHRRWSARRARIRPTARSGAAARPAPGSERRRA